MVLELEHQMKFQKAVVVGCDKKYEHTLGWWLEQYRKTNYLPVIFANFGVSQPTLMWARETFSEVVDVQPENNIFCWGLKQRSVLEAGNFARWVMWIDLDCEINGSLEPFFEPLEFDDDLESQSTYQSSSIPATMPPLKINCKLVFL